MSNLPHDRWLRIDSLFHEALDRPPSERSSFLDEACGSQADIRDEVEELLRLEAASAGFLEHPLEDLTPVPWEKVLAEMPGGGVGPSGSPVETDRSGERIGPYRLVRKLGRGGMATVYLAERADGLWEQEVALKIVRKGLDTDDVVRRFLAERQILSSLGHPNIASLLDGGTTEDGLPYLVMEYVDGTPLTEYCDRHRLSLPSRLELFCSVGRAVEHAHQRLVVHRDIKPSNILVTTQGRVKLLDFGIAKILDPSEDGSLTRTGLLLLTPEYASPEQVAEDAITTASDVYQLGVLLCEILAGRRPRQVRGLLSPSRLQASLEGSDSSPPSALISAEAAEARGLSPERARRRIRGDLDNIVLHAVQREPERRYRTVGELVSDVERHLEGRPVRARPRTLSYRARKLMRRRPWLIPGLAALMVLLGAYVVSLVQQSRRLEEERSLARMEAQRAEEVQRFLVDVFRSADPYAPDQNTDRDITVREAMAIGADRVRRELSDRPALQATLLDAIGDVYANLDLLEPARELREQALRLHRQVHGPESEQVAQGLRKLGRIASLQGQLPRAEELLERSLAMTREVLGPRDTAVAGVLVDLADLDSRRGRMDEAEAHLTEAVELLRSRAPLPVAPLADAYTALLDVYPAQGRLTEARKIADEAVRLTRRAYGPEHPRTAVALVQAADLKDWTGHSPDAVPAYRQAIRILRRNLGPNHQRTLEARNNLAVTLRHMGRLGEAEAEHRKILHAWRAKPSERPTEVAAALQNLAVVLRDEGALEEADRLLQEARDLYDSIPGPGNFRRALPRLTLASVRLDGGAFAEAEAAAREAVGILSPTLSESSYVTATAHCRVARALVGQGRRQEALPILERAVDTLANTTQPSLRYQSECRRALAELYKDLGRRDLAAAEEEELQRLLNGGPGS